MGSGVGFFLSSHAFSRKASSSVASKIRSVADRFKMLVKERRAVVKNTEAASRIEEFYGDSEKLIDLLIEEMEYEERKEAVNNGENKGKREDAPGYIGGYQEHVYSQAWYDFHGKKQHFEG